MYVSKYVRMYTARPGGPGVQREGASQPPDRAHAWCSWVRIGRMVACLPTPGPGTCLPLGYIVYVPRGTYFRSTVGACTNTGYMVMSHRNSNKK